MKLLLYLLRWQLSTPLLALCISLLKFDNITKTVIANLIGGLIFYNIDKIIFKENKKNSTLKKIISG